MAIITAAEARAFSKEDLYSTMEKISLVIETAAKQKKYFCGYPYGKCGWYLHDKDRDEINRPFVNKIILLLNQQGFTARIEGERADLGRCGFGPTFCYLKIEW